MGGLLAFIASLFTTSMSAKAAELGYKTAFETAKFLAWKTIIITLFFTGSLVLVSMVLEMFFTEIYDYVGSQVSGTDISGLNFNLTFTGLTGYLIDILKLDDCLRMIMSALITKFTLKFVPFIRL